MPSYQDSWKPTWPLKGAEKHFHFHQETQIDIGDFAIICGNQRETLVRVLGKRSQQGLDWYYTEEGWTPEYRVLGKLTSTHATLKQKLSSYLHLYKLLYQHWFKSE